MSHGNNWFISQSGEILFFIFGKVYTKSGRRALPTMMMGSSAVFIDCDEFWKLLVVTRMGSFYVWDIFNRNCTLHDSLVALITTDSKSDAQNTGKLVSRS